MRENEISLSNFFRRFENCTWSLFQKILMRPNVEMQFIINEIDHNLLNANFQKNISKKALS